MEQDKIIQLLPAPRTMYASAFDDDGNNRRDLRAVCLALLESGTVRPMVIVGGELTRSALFPEWETETLAGLITRFEGDGVYEMGTDSE